MPTPARSAASMMRVPLGTSTCRPLIVQVTVSFCSLVIRVLRALARLPGGGEALSPDPRRRLDGHRGGGAHAVADVGEVLLAELPDRAGNGCRRRVAEHADRGARHVLPDVEQQVQVLFPALASLDPAEDLRQPRGPLAAVRALAAGLVGVELHDPPRSEER